MLVFTDVSQINVKKKISNYKRSIQYEDYNIVCLFNLRTDLHIKHTFYIFWKFRRTLLFTKMMLQV